MGKALMVLAAGLAILAMDWNVSTQEHNLMLTLEQTSGGRAIYRECRLDVVIFESRGSAVLRCIGDVGRPSEIRKERELTVPEIKIILDFAGKSDLYGGGHLGSDARAVDGGLETLLVRCCGRPESVMLITSGNQTFSDDGPRSNLRNLLLRLEADLREAAPAQK